MKNSLMLWLTKLCFAKELLLNLLTMNLKVSLR